jgi:hypothetical protein
VTVDAADDVERRLGGHRLLLPAARAVTDGQEATALPARAAPRCTGAAATAADAIVSTDPAAEASVWRGLTRLARSGHCRAQAVPPSPSRRRRSAAVIASARPAAPSRPPVRARGAGRCCFARWMWTGTRSAILHCAVPQGGIRQVARAAKGSGL